MYFDALLFLFHKRMSSLQVGVRVFHEEDADTGMGLVKFNEVGPATTELVDNEIKRLLQVYHFIIISSLLFIIITV